MACPGLLPRPDSVLPFLPEEGVIPLPGRPLLARPVPASFPSPAADYVKERLSLDEHLIEHREATFFVRVYGDSMTGFGIHDGDLLVVDRALVPSDRSVVIAVVDGEFTVKQLCHLPEGILLRASGQDHGDILVHPEQEYAIRAEVIELNLSQELSSFVATNTGVNNSPTNNSPTNERDFPVPGEARTRSVAPCGNEVPRWGLRTHQPAQEGKSWKS